MPVALAALSAARPFKLGQVAQRVCRAIAFALPFAAAFSERLQRALDGDRLRQREVLAVAFSANSPRTMSSRSMTVTGIVCPAEQLRRAQPALAGNEQCRPGVRPRWVQQAQLGHAGGEPGDVAHVFAMAFADANRVDRDGWTAALQCGCFVELASAAAQLRQAGETASGPREPIYRSRVSDALRERTHPRAFDACQAALLPIVTPIRLGDSCVTTGPVPLLMMRRPCARRCG